MVSLTPSNSLFQQTTYFGWLAGFGIAEGRAI
jgi:hypothetical protein